MQYSRGVYRLGDVDPRHPSAPTSPVVRCSSFGLHLRCVYVSWLGWAVGSRKLGCPACTAVVQQLGWCACGLSAGRCLLVFAALFSISVDVGIIRWVGGATVGRHDHVSPCCAGCRCHPKLGHSPKAAALACVLELGRRWLIALLYKGAAGGTFEKTSEMNELLPLPPPALPACLIPGLQSCTHSGSGS